MQIEINPLHESISFDDFANKYGLVMEVHERGREWTGTSGQWYAHFKGCDVSDGCMLIGEYGDGKTPEIAISNYKRKIAGKRLAYGSGWASRVQCPSEWKE